MNYIKLLQKFAVLVAVAGVGAAISPPLSAQLNPNPSIFNEPPYNRGLNTPPPPRPRQGPAYGRPPLPPGYGAPPRPRQGPAYGRPPLPPGYGAPPPQPGFPPGY